MIVADDEAEQRIHAQAWWRCLTIRHWNVLIYVVVVPLSYSLGRILSTGKSVTTTTLGGSTSTGTGTVAYQYLHFERCISSRTCSQEEQAQQDQHDMESSYCHHDNIPPTSRSRNLPIFTGTAIDRRNAFRGAATLCDNGSNYKTLAPETFAEMFIQPAMLIHPNTRLKIAIYVAAACPVLTTTRAMLQLLEYFSSSIDQVYIFSNGDDNHDADLLDVGRSPDSNLTVHVGHPFSMVLPNMDNHTSPRERISFDIVFLGGEMMMVRDSSSSSISFGPTFWSEYLDPKNGILVMPLVGHGYHDRIQRLQVELVQTGQHYYFDKVTDYESHHDTSFLHFAIAFKNKVTYAHWHLNEAEYMLRMHKRRIPYDDDLQVFLDGATMTTLAFPSRMSTRAFCDLKYGNVCDEMEHASGVDPFQDNIPYSKIAVQPSSLGELAGRGVFTTVDAPKGTYFDLETSSQSIQASWTTTNLIFPEPQQKSLFDAMGQPLHHYFDGYGFYDEPFGEVSSFVDSGIMTFPNHGCNSSYNVGSALSVNEFDVILGQPPPDDFFPSFQRSVYDPLGERHALFDKVTSRSQRDIMAGEELFDNYIFFGGATYFHDMAKSLRDQCLGMAGEIEEFQRQKSSQK